MEALLKTASLTPQAYEVIVNKGTEAPNTGEYNLTDVQGTYLCRQCGLALFRSTDKFIASCGWPSFDDEIANTIKRQFDADGRRTEILCERCDGHLGHAFSGEGYTKKNLRHCVNSLSVDFVENTSVKDTHEAIYAGGCFWGVQTLLEENPGVLKVEVGYCGGTVLHPSYDQVCAGGTGHLEAVRVIYDPSQIDYEALTKDFFSIHDPTQGNGQGPDLGSQYLSAIFCYNEQQRNTCLSLIEALKQKGFNVRTDIRNMDVFWRAEEYHQDYYKKTGKTPYCHARTKRFDW